MNDLERVLARITLSDDGCWIYPTCSSERYGVLIRKDEGHRSAVSTHRFVYSEIVGEIPERLQLDHLCRVRACCNPDHLEPVTQAENIRRAVPYRTTSTKFARVIEGPITGADLASVVDSLALLRPFVRDRKTIYRLIDSGHLDGRKINGAYWITRHSINRYLTEGEQ